jgi:hypothetical protein
MKRRGHEHLASRKTDEKNVQLLKLLAQVRDDIDIHRIIGLNVSALRKTAIGEPLLGYLQRSAHESLAICFCTIFESSKRNDLNSIPGILESPQVTQRSDQQKRDLAVFGTKYGSVAAPQEAAAYLKETLDAFRTVHAEALDRLKQFRNTIGAHSDYAATITSLPSHAEFETLFAFANDFYTFVAHSINNVGPAVIPRQVGRGFIRLIESMGIQSPRFDFDQETE